MMDDKDQSSLSPRQVEFSGKNSVLRRDTYFTLLRGKRIERGCR